MSAPPACTATAMSKGTTSRAAFHIWSTLVSGREVNHENTMMRFSGPSSPARCAVPSTSFFRLAVRGGHARLQSMLVRSPPHTPWGRELRMVKNSLSPDVTLQSEGYPPSFPLFSHTGQCTVVWR